MAVGHNQFFGPFAPTAFASTRGSIWPLHDLFVMATLGYLLLEDLAVSWVLTFPRLWKLWGQWVRGRVPRQRQSREAHREIFQTGWLNPTESHLQLPSSSPFLSSCAGRLMAEWSCSNWWGQVWDRKGGEPEAPIPGGPVGISSQGFRECWGQRCSTASVLWCSWKGGRLPPSPVLGGTLRRCSCGYLAQTHPPRDRSWAQVLLRLLVHWGREGASGSTHKWIPGSGVWAAGGQQVIRVDEKGEAPDQIGEASKISAWAAPGPRSCGG